MNLALVTSAVVIIVVMVLLYILSRTVGKIAWYAIMGLVLIASVLSIAMIIDVNDFNVRFPQAKNLYLLSDSKLVAGFEQMMVEDMAPVDEARLADLQKKLDTKDYKAMIGDSYKLFIIEKAALKNVTAVNLGERSITAEQALMLLDSGDSRNDYVKLIYPDIKEENKRLIGANLSSSDAEFKAMIFAGMLTQSMKADPAFIFRQKKAGFLMIYPETIALKFMGILPLSFIESIYTS